MMYVHSYQSYIWNICASERIKKYGLKLAVGDLVLKKEAGGGGGKEGWGGEGVNEKVKVVGEEEVKAGEYGIMDVVLPLPGSEILYPGNEIKGVYKEILGKDGIRLVLFSVFFWRNILHAGQTSYIQTNFSLLFFFSSSVWTFLKKFKKNTTCAANIGRLFILPPCSNPSLHFSPILKTSSQFPFLP